MGRPRTKTNRRIDRYTAPSRGAFARHLQAQIDSEGNNLNLMPPTDDARSSSPSSKPSSPQLDFQQRLDAQREKDSRRTA